MNRSFHYLVQPINNFIFSPIETAECGKGYYQAYFLNIEEKFHSKLKGIIEYAGWSRSAHCFKIDSSKYVKSIPGMSDDSTIFLYLDPFGLKGCGFDVLEPFLQRDPAYSTEIVLTMCMPVLHRLASYRAIQEGKQSITIQKYHQVLTKVLGDETWKEFMLQDIEAEIKEKKFIEAYLNKIKRYMRYTGYCPVKEGKRVKYFIVFASRNPDAMLLMNDNMVNAYFKAKHEEKYTKTLFEDFDWKTMPDTPDREPKKLDQMILNLISNYPNRTRDELWLLFVQEHFMRFNGSEYKEALKRLENKHEILYPVDKNTKKHNGSCRINLP